MGKIKIGIICILCLCLILPKGCGKKWWDYLDGDYAWVSEEPYIYLPLVHDEAVIEVGGEKRKVETGWENSGSQIEFCEIGTNDEEGIIWEADVKLKWGKLYLTIIKDNYGDDEGKKAVLEKRPVGEE